MSETPITDGLIGNPGYDFVAGTRELERRLNACVEALEDLLEPPAFRHEVFAAEQKAQQALANAKKPLP